MAGDQWVRVWADGYHGSWGVSGWVDRGAYAGDEHNWEAYVHGEPRDGLWHVCMVPEDGDTTCISDTMHVQTSADCHSAGGIQVAHITFTKN